MSKPAVYVLAFALLALVVAASSKGTSPDLWSDTELTTNMWGIISSGDKIELAELLESNGDVATIRSGDGRGPLWWAYEYEQPEMVKMLVDAGANEAEMDGDGKTPNQMSGVGPTKYQQEMRQGGGSYAQDDYQEAYHGAADDDEFDEDE